jgi:hypothetical protein
MFSFLAKAFLSFFKPLAQNEKLISDGHCEGLAPTPLEKKRRRIRRGVHHDANVPGKK